jgi:hypothetical protein
MTAHYLMIEGKHRQMRGFHASLADFSVTNAEMVSANIVRTHPNISLYCLDDAAKQAIFVELPPDVDLTKAPFMYQTQYEQAQRLIAMPYDTFREVGSQLPEVKHLVMIYMTGRSGSTLLSNLFNELDTVLSLSEPDVATHFVNLRNTDGSRDAELTELLESTVRFLFKPTAFKTPSALVLKLRNEGTQLMDLFQATFPQAKNLFLYRDAIGFVQSFYRIITRGQSPEPMPLGEFVAGFRQISNYDLTHLTAYLDEGTTELSTLQFLTLWWLAVMEWYLVQHERGIPALAVRYEDLNGHRERVITEVFKYCNLPTARVQETLGVFARDAQAGTELARENPQEGNQLKLSNEQLDELIRIVKHHPIIKDSDFVVPGTLHV